MSTTSIPLFSKRSFDFSNLQNGTTQTIVIAKAIDVSQYTSGTLEVRLHSNNTTIGSAHIYLQAHTTAPSIEDPSKDFYASGTVARVDINSQAAPLLAVASLGTNFGSMLRITMEAEQPAGGGLTSAELSAVLTLKA